MMIRQYFLSDGGVLSSDLTKKERMYLTMWERFKVAKVKPWEWLTNGVMMEEHINALVEMQKLTNTKNKMDADLEQKRRASKSGTTISKGF